MLFPPPEPEVATAARILIVEDEGIIAGHIASRLLKTGYEVAGIAESSEEALSKILELKPELVLMDIHIKGAMDGIETTAKLRETFDIPVIYLTAHTDQGTIDRAKLTGAYGFLTKPIHHTSLSTAIEMAIHKHRADREGRNQRAWISTVVGTMADAIAVIDRNGKIQFLNRPAEELTGWMNQDARDLDIALVLPLTDSASGSHAEETLLLHSDPRPPGQLPRGLTAHSRAGKRFPIEGEIAPSVDVDGRVVGAVITFRDATTRQAQESELRHEYKMQAVGRLAAGIAHDFNNLLFVILGYTEEMLRSSALKDSDLRALSEIKKAGENATNITQQLLKFSRKEPVEEQDVNLNETIRETEEIFRRMGGPSVKWRFTFDDDLGTVRADRGQLKQVLMNLVVNARDAMPKGGTVSIETANLDLAREGSAANPREPLVAVSVTDTGIGMSGETAERLFEPFFTTKGPGKGTGLGLSIVHSIVTDLGGSIHVDSVPGEGSTFTVYFPRTAAAAAPAAAGAPAPRAAPNPATVLLAEDDASIRRLLCAYLVSSGCTVLLAEDGDEAIQIANRHAGPIDLLITDVVMGKANGFEVARAVAGSRAQIKVILISGYAPELVAGIEDMPPGALFLPKPFTKTELLKHMSSLLNQEKNLTMKSSG